MSKQDKKLKKNNIGETYNINTHVDNIQVNIDSYKKKNEEGQHNFGAKITAVVSFLVLLIGLIITIKTGFFSGSFNSLKINSVRILPYKRVPYVEYEGEEIYDTVQDDNKIIETDKAIVIRSNIYNPKSKVKKIDRIRTHVKKLEPIMKSDIHLEAHVTNGVLKQYILNNGWLDASGVKTEFFIKNTFSGEYYNLEDISDEVIFNNDITDIPSQAIIPVSECVLSVEKYKKLNEYGENLSSTIVLGYRLDGNEYLEGTLLLFEGELQVNYGGGEDPFKEIELFGKLDVDKNPEWIEYIGVDAEPIISAEGYLQVDNIIAPTKSCKVTLENEYKVGNNKYITDTDDYTIFITVSAFKENAFYYMSEHYFGGIGELTDKLAKYSNPEQNIIKSLTQEYNYDPNSAEDIYINY